MQVHEVIAELQKMDPEADVYIMDGEYGPQETTSFVEEIVTVESASGKHLPKMVKVLA